MNRSPLCRPLVLCTAFLSVAALVVAGLGWVTAAALGVEASELQAVARAEQANKERIALWRLDGQLLPALGLENNRPFSHYTALSDPLPAVLAEKESLASSEVRLPSPLLAADLPAWMPLHFTFDPDAGWSSPQVLAAPLAGKLRGLDVPLSNVTDARAARLAELRAQFPTAAVAATLSALDPIDVTDPSPVVLPTNDVFSQNPNDPANTLNRSGQPGGGGFGGGGGQAGGFGGVAGQSPARSAGMSQSAAPAQMPDSEFLRREQATQKNLMNRGGYDNTAGPRNSATVSPTPLSATQPEREADKLSAAKSAGEGVNPATTGRAMPPPSARAMFPAAPAAPAGPTGGAAGGRGGAALDGVAKKADEEAKRKSLAEAVPDRVAGFGHLMLKDRATISPPVLPPLALGLQAIAGGTATRPTVPPPPKPMSMPFGQPADSPLERQQRPEKKETDRPAAVGRRITAKPVAAHIGPLRPVWLTAADGSDALILVRTARLETGKTVYQGVLVDWPTLQRELAALVADLFPDATLAPVRGPAPAAPERTMTAVPARLDPGPDPPAPAAGWSSLRLGLGLAWVAALLGLTAVGVGGRALVDLSERRIRFVSAVTHELRTPLTSLRLYLDLLTSGLVTDPNTQREYLGTLSSESDRLNRLIENVLDFARLEKRTVKAVLQPTPVADLLDTVLSTWADRLTADGKELVVHSTLPPGQAVRTDPRVAAQVVGNLIDNARKYSREAADPRVWVWARPGSRGRVLIEVEDRGPGVPVPERRGIFRAFRRGRDADTTAGGAGLGLALAKQWAGLLGGDLDYRPADGGVGACFRLELPAG